jgi:hypothetical protein
MISTSFFRMLPPQREYFALISEDSSASQGLKAVEQASEVHIRKPKAEWNHLSFQLDLFSRFFSMLKPGISVDRMKGKVRYA